MHRVRVLQQQISPQTTAVVRPTSFLFEMNNKKPIMISQAESAEVLNKRLHPRWLREKSSPPPEFDVKGMQLWLDHDNIEMRAELRHTS